MQITTPFHEAGATMSIETLDLDDPQPTEIVVEIAGTDQTNRNDGTGRGRASRRPLRDRFGIAAGWPLRGCSMGRVNPGRFIPQVVRILEQNLPPLDKMSTSFTLSDIDAELAAAADGAVVKPVLVA
jgi:Zn-dependent alcohol dehydrogenase